MIPGIPAWQQALLGTLFTWFVTALGSGVVFIAEYLPGDIQKWLDTMLGFAGGVMIAASYWSLLAPAIEMAERTPFYQDTHIATRPDGSPVTLAWLPVAVGFAAGGVFLALSDSLVQWLTAKWDPQNVEREGGVRDSSVSRPSSGDTQLRRRKGGAEDSPVEEKKEGPSALEWRRTLLLVLAITLHNLPEGLAVGVAFGALGTDQCQRLGTCSFGEAFNLALGIGIQNFPEGLAVSLPLRRHGVSPLRAFFFGQLSGAVEPVAGLAGALLVQGAEPILPYAMAFAAGAMIFVVADDLIPDAQRHGNGRLASLGCVAGFVTMMVLDVALG